MLLLCVVMTRLSHRLLRSIQGQRSILLVRAALFAITLVILIGGALLAALLAARPDWPGWLTLVSYLLPILGALLIAQGLYRLDADLAQHGRDLQAGDIFAALGRGEQPDFCLYLRPFASTDAIDTYQPRRILPGGGPQQAMIASERLEFETELERAVRPIAPLVALGEPLEHEGAGRIRVGDHEWRGAIRDLMAGARLIILLPAARPGTFWEVEQILSRGHVAKTVVIDPPDRGAAHGDFDPAARWEDVRLAFARAGYALPEDDEGGLILRFGTGRRAPIARRALAIDALARMRSFLLAAARAGRTA